MKRKTKDDPRWTYCRDCVYWRTFEEPDTRPAEDTGGMNACFRHAADVVNGNQDCRGGNGCGDGVKR